MRYFKLIGILAIHFGQDLNMRLRWFSLYCFKTKQNSKNTRRVPLAGKSTTVFFCFSLFFFFLWKQNQTKKQNKQNNKGRVPLAGQNTILLFFFFVLRLYTKRQILIIWMSIINIGMVLWYTSTSTSKGSNICCFFCFFFFWNIFDTRFWY